MSDKNEIQMTQRGLALTNLEDMFRLAQYVVASNLAPAGFKTPEQVIVALQTGAELGLPAMASLRSLAVINGRATLYGDAGLALVRRSGKLEAFKETLEGDIGIDILKTPNEVLARCSATRDGVTVESTFSVADAKRAGLWGKSGPWKTHPQRMLKFKTRAFTLRDLFGDVLEGLSFYEEFVGTEEAEPTNEDRIKADMGSKKVESVTVKPELSEGEKQAIIDHDQEAVLRGPHKVVEPDRVEELAEIVEASTSDEPEWL